MSDFEFNPEEILNRVDALRKDQMERIRQEHQAQIEMSEAVMRSFIEGLNDTQLEDLSAIIEAILAHRGDEVMAASRVSGILIGESWRRKPETFSATD